MTMETYVKMKKKHPATLSGPMIKVSKTIASMCGPFETMLNVIKAGFFNRSLVLLHQWNAVFRNTRYIHKTFQTDADAQTIFKANHAFPDDELKLKMNTQKHPEEIERRAKRLLKLAQVHNNDDIEFGDRFADPKDTCRIDIGVVWIGPFTMKPSMKDMLFRDDLSCCFNLCIANTELFKLARQMPSSLVMRTPADDAKFVPYTVNEPFAVNKYIVQLRPSANPDLPIEAMIIDETETDDGRAKRFYHLNRDMMPETINECWFDVQDDEKLLVSFKPCVGGLFPHVYAVRKLSGRRRTFPDVAMKRAEKIVTSVSDVYTTTDEERPPPAKKQRKKTKKVIDATTAGEPDSTTNAKKKPDDGGGAASSEKFTVSSRTLREILTTPLGAEAVDYMANGPTTEAAAEEDSSTSSSSSSSSSSTTSSSSSDSDDSDTGLDQIKKSY